MSSNGLIRDVSRELRLYYERTRREEGFDISAAPRLDFDKYKHITLSASSKSFESQTQKQQNQNNQNNRENVIKAKLMRALYKKSTYESPYSIDLIKSDKPKSKRQRAKSAHNVLQPKITPSSSYIPMGLLELRNKPSPYLTKGEKKRVIETTTKLLTATDDILVKIFHHDERPQKTKLTRENLQRNDEQHLIEYKIANQKQEREEEEEEEAERRLVSKNQDSYFDSHSSKSSPKKLECNETVTSVKVEAHVRPKTSKRSQLRQACSNESSKHEIKREENYDFNSVSEITTGPKYKYLIKVETGSCVGAGTDAHIYIQLYGTRGKTNAIRLDNSSSHKVPFQRTNTDLFEVLTYDVGSMKGIHIGHNRLDVVDSWFLERVTIDDQLNSLSYIFECHKWLKNDSCTQASTRILPLTHRNTLFPQTEKITKCEDLNRSSSRLSLTTSSQSQKVNRSLSTTSLSESPKPSPQTTLRSNASTPSSETPIAQLTSKYLDESKNTIQSTNASISSDSTIDEETPKQKVTKKTLNRQDTLSADNDDDDDEYFDLRKASFIETATKNANDDDDDFF